MRFLTKAKVVFGPTLVLTRHPLQVPVLGGTDRGPHILNQHEDWDGQFRLPPGFEYCTVGLVKRVCQSTRGLIFWYNVQFSVQKDAFITSEPRLASWLLLSDWQHCAFHWLSSCYSRLLLLLLLQLCGPCYYHYLTWSHYCIIDGAGLLSHR